MQDYCKRVAEAGTAEGVDGISGATLCTSAIKEGVTDCTIQALGIVIPSAAVLNP